MDWQVFEHCPLVPFAVKSLRFELTLTSLHLARGRLANRKLSFNEQNYREYKYEHVETQPSKSERIIP